MTAIDSTINNKIIKLNNDFGNKMIFYPLKKSDNPQPNIICLIVDSSLSLVIDIKDDFLVRILDPKTQPPERR